MFEPEFADDAESGELFACEECHEFMSYDSRFCPDCHVGACEGCGIAVTPENLGERDFIEPAIVFCRACYLHDNGVPSPCATPAVIRLYDAIRIACSDRPKLTHAEKTALSLLR